MILPFSFDIQAYGYHNRNIMSIVMIFLEEFFLQLSWLLGMVEATLKI